jgi:CRP-like cAMP-binding protein
MFRGRGNLTPLARTATLTPMGTTLDLETLRAQSRLFSLLDDAGQQRLLEAAEERAFDTGEALMNEGETGDAFFVVTDGFVRVFVHTADKEKEVALLGSGAFVGEIAALMGEPRNASVMATEPVETLAFDAARVNEILKDYPKVREALVKLALKRSEDNLQRMLDVSEPDGAPVSDEDEG